MSKEAASTRILVIACHLDDEALGVGGTIAQHAAHGDEIHVANLCLSAHKVAEIRACAAQVQEVLGIERYHICKLPHGELEANTHKAIGILERIVEETRPDIIYTHHRGDSHQDHRAAFFITMSALRLNRGAKVSDMSPRILSYEVLSSTERAAPFMDLSFIPNFFVEITSQMDKKLEAVGKYGTETGRFPHPRSLEGVQTLARYRGMQAGVEGAESFMLIREVVKDN